MLKTFVDNFLTSFHKKELKPQEIMYLVTSAVFTEFLTKVGIVRIVHFLL